MKSNEYLHLIMGAVATLGLITCSFTGFTAGQIVIAADCKAQGAFKHEGRVFECKELK